MTNQPHTQFQAQEFAEVARTNMASFSRVTFVLKWLGMVTGALGAVWLALNLDTSGWGYVLFAVSSASWLTAGMMMKEHSLTSMNGIYFAINLMGIYRWLIA